MINTWNSIGGLILLCASIVFITHAVAFFILYIIMSKCSAFRICGRESRRIALLVIAHPDDETMFFGPTILRLTGAGVRVFVLCVTTGNVDGLGETRKIELVNAAQFLGIRPGDLTIMDYDEFPDVHADWPEIKKLARIVLNKLVSIDADLLITFDAGGISGHPNHISCYKAVRHLLDCNYIPSNLSILFLETVNLLRKYMSIMDVTLSWFGTDPPSSRLSPSSTTSSDLDEDFNLFTESSICFLAGPWQVLSAMLHHRSQLLWFRYLYMIFSRYIFINTLRVMQKRKLL